MTYWESTGKHQALADQLSCAIPLHGELDGAKVPKLERFRQMGNCYYDLYNNGLCNRANEFRKLFGIASSKYRSGRFYSQEMLAVVENQMDWAVFEAAKEQGLIA